MARTYEIYLRNRLTEFDLIIQNLPYRETTATHAKLYLDAMVNYLFLQKFIVGEDNLALQTEIDRLLTRVFNAFHHESVLQVQAGAVAEKPVGASSDLCLQTQDMQVHEESFHTLAHVMSLTTAALVYDLQKSVGEGTLEMVLTSKVASAIKETFDRLNDVTVLDAASGSSAHKFEQVGAKVQLQTNPFRLFYMIGVQCEALLTLSCAMESEVWFSLGRAETTFYFTVQAGDTCEEKHCSADTMLTLLGELNATLGSFLSPSNLRIGISAVMDALLMRYRKVAEVDPLSVSDMDAMSLQDLDYVILD